jgi:hypothetical protein
MLLGSKQRYNQSLKLIPTKNVGTGWKVQRAFSPRDIAPEAHKPLAQSSRKDKTKRG